jgi:hypothetical protein
VTVSSPGPAVKLPHACSYEPREGRERTTRYLNLTTKTGFDLRDGIDNPDAEAA